jgi:hypothetical protein
VALLEKRRFLYNHSGDFPQVILIIPSHVPNKDAEKSCIFNEKDKSFLQAHNLNLKN